MTISRSSSNISIGGSQTAKECADAVGRKNWRCSLSAWSISSQAWAHIHTAGSFEFAIASVSTSASGEFLRPLAYPFVSALEEPSILVSNGRALPRFAWLICESQRARELLAQRRQL